MDKTKRQKSVKYFVTLGLVVILAIAGILTALLGLDFKNVKFDKNNSENNAEIAAEALPPTAVVGTKWLFNYTGGVQSFTVAKDGYYFVQLWGASGGGNTPNTNVGSMAGAGGYTEGSIWLTQNTVLYFHVGSQGQYVINTFAAGGYNGGGKSGNNIGGGSSGGGGGATDVRLETGTWNNADGLRSRIMVAGGGGGSDDTDGGTYSGNNDGRGGAGGGINGENGFVDGVLSAAMPGGRQTNTTATGQASFGIGGDAILSDYSDAGGGGGGYYGGAGSNNFNGGGGGGSSYISGLTGCNSVTSKSNGAHTGSPNHYSGKVFTAVQTINGVSSMPIPSTGASRLGNIGNGYARISWQRNNLPIEGEAGNREKETTRSGEEIEYIVKNGHARSIGKDKDEEDELGYYLKKDKEEVEDRERGEELTIYD